MNDALRALLALPRGEQPAAVEALLAALLAARAEAWNTRFGPDSLYAAWSETSLLRGLYEANAVALRPILARPGFRVIDVGGGDGRLWAHALPADAEGEIVVVDPVPEAHDAVRARVPAGVTVTSLVAVVQDATLPDADAAVCSLVLHHIAGADAAERALHGLPGVGKLEVLRRLRAALAPRDGLLIVNEADVFCDLALPAGDPVLVDRLLDSYVRRCAAALLDDLDAHPSSPHRARWEAIVRHWCLEQVRAASLPTPDRDVYELDVPRWLALFGRAGLYVTERGFTDRYGLFCRYAARTRETPSS